MSEIIVTMEHVRAAKLGGVGVLCAPGIRAWCERHQINLRAFTEYGMPITQLEAIDDAYAQRIAAIARAQAAAQEADRG